MAEDLKKVAAQTAGFAGKPLTVADAFPDAETVTMVFPHPVNLTLDNHKTIHFAVGPQEVPVALKDHWYLKANRVVLYAPTLAEEKLSSTPQPMPEIERHHLNFLQSRGYCCQEGVTLEDAKRFILNLSPWERQGFFKEAEAWKGKVWIGREPSPETSIEDEDDLASEDEDAKTDTSEIAPEAEEPEQDPIRFRTPRRKKRA